MKKGLINYLDMIDAINNIIFSKIKVGNTKTFYTVDSIMAKYLDDKKIPGNDFHNTWSNEELHLLLKNLIDVQNDHIIGIMSNYSGILTRGLLKEIRDHICIYSNALKNLPQKTTLLKRNEESLRVLVHTTGIVIGLRETYNI